VTLHDFLLYMILFWVIVIWLDIKGIDDDD